MIFFALIAGLIAASAAYQSWAAHRDRLRLQPPGRLIQTACGALYLHEQGQGSPTVLLESGLAASSLSWALVQPQVAEFTRVCSYDRAGFGWSLPSSKPRTVGNLTAELAMLLKDAGLQPPYVLVGHSFGGLLTRAFAHLHPGDVAGMVLVDPVSLQYWSECGPNDQKRLRSGVNLSRRGALLARLGVVRLALLLLAEGRTRLPRLIARASSGKANDLISRLAGEIRKLPPAAWPLIRAHWSRSPCFQTMAAYLQNLPQNAQEAARMEIPARIPLTILSASNVTEGELQEREIWAKQSQNGRHIRLNEGGHWIQLEHPETVVVAIREMVNSPSVVLGEHPSTATRQ
ncbi:MAG: alpha/beta hydrolase [Bryobacteraceae bacterium]